MKRKINDHIFYLVIKVIFFLLSTIFIFILWKTINRHSDFWLIIVIACSILLVLYIWMLYLRYKVSQFSDKLCNTLDSLIAGRQPENYFPYEDSLTTKIENKLLQYYDIMQAGRDESKHDKEIIQALVSDISHQVKTPIANAKMFTNILQKHEIPQEKKIEFLSMLDGQIDKLDFLMQSLIKMSRLETGTFILHIEQKPIYNTIALALDGVWIKAEEKNISLSVDCDSSIIVKHDIKWTAEALMNLLDNSIKYTSIGGSVTINVFPWQFYTRIDIIDTGIGIKEEDYHRIFKRFYRSSEVANKEGVGLGLYLAQGIITRQKGYISLKSKHGSGTVFSVHLLN